MKWKGKIDFEEHPEYDGYLLLSEDAGEFNALTEKTDLVDDDLVIIEDSEDSYAKKKAKRSNIGGGSIIQIVTLNVTTVIQTSVSIVYGSTPTNASGTAWFSQAITLTDSTNSVRIQIIVPFDSSQDGDGVVVLVHRGSTVLAVLPGQVGKKSKSGSAVYVDFYDTPGSVGPHTYSFRVGRQVAGTTSVNRVDMDATPWGGTLLTNSCNLTLTETE
jgi:hypothetical protein